MKTAPSLAACLLLLGLLAPPAFGQAQPTAQSHNQQQVGTSVRTPTAVGGDFGAAGWRILVDQPVAGDALLAGGSVEVRAAVAQDLRATGGDVVVQGSVGGDLSVLAGSLRLADTAQVLGRADLAGGEVLLLGQVAGPLRVRARSLLINGKVGGDVQATAQRLELGPLAHIGGGLRHSSGSFIRDPAAVVEGPVIGAEGAREQATGRSGFPQWSWAWAWDGQHPMHSDHWGGHSGWWLLAPVVMTLVGLLALVAVVLFVFAGFSDRAAAQIVARPWHALALGTGLVLALPVLAMLLFFTLVGIPLGLAVLALYPALLLLGGMISALFVARQVALRAQPERPFAGWTRMAWAGLSVLVLLLAGAIPLLGPLLVFAAVVLGLGACVLEWRSRMGPA